MAVEAVPERFAANCDECDTDVTFEWSDVCYSRPLLEHYVTCPICNARIVVAPNGTNAETIKHLREHRAMGKT